MTQLPDDLQGALNLLPEAERFFTNQEVMESIVTGVKGEMGGALMDVISSLPPEHAPRLVLAAFFSWLIYSKDEFAERVMENLDAARAGAKEGDFDEQ